MGFIFFKECEITEYEYMLIPTANIPLGEQIWRVFFESLACQCHSHCICNVCPLGNVPSLLLKDKHFIE